jgi:hypothetical protein
VTPAVDKTLLVRGFAAGNTNRGEGVETAWLPEIVTTRLDEGIGQ